MRFSTALELMIYGMFVSREAWDNAEFYTYLDKETKSFMLHKDDEPTEIIYFTADDLLTTDWYIVC